MHIVFTQQMKQVVVKQLQDEKWSPEIISVEGNRSGQCPLSHEWIYNGYGSVNTPIKESINPIRNCMSV
jgi:IS30 family transposase